jgi:HSP20 family protein
MVPNEDDRQAVYVAPPADVESTDVGYVIRAEMPGVEMDCLEITVDRGELIILGRRKPIEVTGELIYREIRRHDFRCVYELAPSIDSTNITANIEQWILTVTLPKSRNRQASQDRCAISFASMRSGAQGGVTVSAVR